MAGVDWSNWVTPTLAANPGAAFDVANSQDPAGTAGPVSHAVNVTNHVDAINDYADSSGTQSFWSKVGNRLGTSLEALGKPLQEIQRDYKFLHSVYTDHSFWQGFLATMGVVGGAVGGGFLGGPRGALAGAEAAAVVERAMGKTLPQFKDSIAKSEDENYKVSPGRDFSNLVSQAASAVGADGVAKQLKVTDQGVFGGKGSTVSGFGDAAFDLVTDPIAVVARFGQALNTGKLLAHGTTALKYPMTDVVPGARNFLLANSRDVLSADAAIVSEQLDAVRNGVNVLGTNVSKASRQYNRAIEDIAHISSTAKSSAEAAGEIAFKYKDLGTAAAGRLGSLKTADEVHEFFKTSLYFGELAGTLGGRAMLPSRTLLRAKIGDSVIAKLQEMPSGKYKLVDTVSSQGVPVQVRVEKTLAERMASLPGGLYRTFTGYMPYSVDAETAKLSTTKFRWNSTDAANVIYRIGKMGMGEQGAKEMAGKYAEAVATGDLNLARIIKNQTLFETFKSLGLPDDSALVKKVFDDLNNIGSETPAGQVYYVDPLGNPMGQYTDKSGVLSVDGVAPHQAATMFDIPDFFAIRKAMRDMGKLKKGYGKIDEFIANQYTNKIFKPLALATTGFGLRVAAAELIPAAARYGIVNMFKARLAASAAKANTNLLPEESKHLFPAILGALGAHMGISADVMSAGWPAFMEAKRRGLTWAAKLTAEQQFDHAMKLAITNQSHFLSEGASAGHGYEASTAYQAGQHANYYFQIQKNSPLYTELPEYTTFTTADVHYVPRYATNLLRASKEAHNQNIAADLIDQTGSMSKLQIEDDIDKLAAHNQYKQIRQNLIDAEHKRMLDTLAGKYKPYAKESTELVRWQKQDTAAFAAERVDAALGMMIGRDGTILKDISKNLKEGAPTDINDLAAMKLKNPRSLPAAVAGPVMQPYVPGNTIGDKIQQISNLGWKKVIDPIVSGMSREPLYLIHFSDAYARYEPLVKQGLIEDSQAVRYAQNQATLSILPQIHNTALRNQFSQLARNFLPFYFAQEQALKRAYATLKDTSVLSPVFSRGLRFYQLTEQALNDPTFMSTDDQGNKYVYIPGGTYFGQAVQSVLNAFGMPMEQGLPLSVKGSMTSLKSVLPELQTPGVSPFFAINANALASFFPGLKPIVKATVGDISFQRGVTDSLIPAPWFKNLVSALSPIDINNAMNSATASALAAAYYHGQVPPPNADAAQLQDFVEKIKNNARSVLIVKSLLGLISPLAPQVSQEDVGLRDEFWKLVKEKGNYGDALTEFLGTHGTSAVSYTVSKTENMIPGAKYPYVQQTVDYIKGNPDLFDSNSKVHAGAFFLIPQDPSAKNDKTIYNELVGMNLRSNRTPAELLRQFYIAQGDAIIGPDRDAHLKALEAAKFDPFSTKMENDRWSALIKDMAKTHPIWYDSYTNASGKNDAKKAYNQLQEIFSPANPNQPQHEQAQLVKALMADYQVHAQRLADFKMYNVSGVPIQNEKDEWQNYLMAVATNDPRLAAVVNSVFAKLD